MRMLWAAMALVLGCGSPATSPTTPAEVGNEQPAAAVAAAPSTAVAVVIDRSGSMTGVKLESAKAGALDVASALPEGALVTVIAFDAEAITLVPLQDASRTAEIEAGIAQLTPGGGTNYFPGLQLAFEALAVVPAERKLVLFLSDGEAPYDGVAELVEEMTASGIRTSAFGLAGADAQLLGMIADAGGGAVFMVDDVAQIGAVMRRAITE